MSSRRQFLKNLGHATAGVCFTGCGLTASAQALMAAGQAAAPRGKRREVTVGGRRVKVIDLHCHIGVPEIWDVIKDHPVPPSLRMSRMLTFSTGRAATPRWKLAGWRTWIRWASMYR